MTQHQKRRVLALWAPLALVGCALCLIAAPLSLTLNGLGLAGMVIGYAGILAACWDDHQVRTGNLP